MMDKEQFREKLKRQLEAPITDPVAELESFLKQFWGNGETDAEVEAWLAWRGGAVMDSRGLEAWEMVLQGDTSDSDLIRLVYAACQFDLQPLDGPKARKWLAEKLEWMHEHL
jgi:hypothetical protein